MDISIETKAKEIIRNYSDDNEFEQTALSIFNYQFNNNTIYNQYCNALGRIAPKSLSEIPFMPVTAFKNQIVSCTEEHEAVFISSGTSSTTASKHFVHKLDFYRESFVKAFETFYGKPSNWLILALLPSYLERTGSSLIMMVKDLQQQSNDQQSGFFLYEHDKLHRVIVNAMNSGKKILLIGVSFALLDFSEKYSLENNKLLTVMETGGMKGRKKEMIREDLHTKLKTAFGVSSIHSEYGMTELLSQAYAETEGLFQSPPWMKVLIREQDDPFSYCAPGITGGINIMDFANIHSCSFISTQDLGKQHTDGRFEVLGRFDSSEIRGCNLMLS